MKIIRTKEECFADTIKLSYYDGSDQKQERGFTDGAYGFCRVYPTSPNYSSVEKYKDNIYAATGTSHQPLVVNIDHPALNSQPRRRMLKRHQLKAFFTNRLPVINQLALIGQKHQITNEW